MSLVAVFFVDQDEFAVISSLTLLVLDSSLFMLRHTGRHIS